MNTKLPLLSLLLAFSLHLGAQTARKEVPLKPEFVPHTWIMMPATEFFELTGLSATDTISTDAYLIGNPEGEHVVAIIEHIEELGIDVVSWVEYIQFKNKNMKKVTAEIQAKYKPEEMGTDSVWYEYFTPDAFVEISLTSNNKKTSSLLLNAYQLYQFMPPIEQAMAKLDSTWQQLATNFTYGEREVIHDSDGYAVRISDVTAMVGYYVEFPSDRSKKPSVGIYTKDDGGYAAMNWAVKVYYDMFLDEYEGTTYWVKDTDKDWVGMGVLFDNGVLLNKFITQEEYQEWIQDGESDEE